MQPQRETPEFVQQLLASMDLKKHSSSKKPSSDKEIKTDSSSDEEEEPAIVKPNTVSPNKYFGKRVSFDYHNLKKIEKPIFRRQSLANSGTQTDSFKKETEAFKKDTEGLLVKFDEKTEEIKGEEKEPTKESEESKGKSEETKKKSILKNTCFAETLEVGKIFIDKQFFQELMERIGKECGENQEFLREKLSGMFAEFIGEKMGNKGKETIGKIIRGINLDYLRYLFKEGIEMKLFVSFIVNIRENLEGNEEIFIEFLEHLTRVRRFKFCISCLLPQEKEEINKLMRLIEKAKFQDAETLDSLKKHYLKL